MLFRSGVFALFPVLDCWFSKGGPPGGFLVLNYLVLNLAIAVPSLGMCVFLFLQARKSRLGPSFDAYADHFRVRASQMRPLPEINGAIFLGEMAIPWSQVESYSWEPDHLEITIRATSRLKKTAYRWRVCGVVPKDQQQAAHTFLAARFPGKGEPG